MAALSCNGCGNSVNGIGTIILLTPLLTLSIVLLLLLLLLLTVILISNQYYKLNHNNNEGYRTSCFHLLCTQCARQCLGYYYYYC